MSQRPRLERLKIHRYRNIRPGSEIRFSEGFNVLLGHNGSGKTTLLNLISMVLRSDFSALREERFEIEFELSNEHGRLIGEIKNDPTSHDDTIISEPLNELTRWRSQG
ncbi:MAG: AAA family ATPase [Deltaproteobacteria bacterium]|nr:AAA family ATPase [Deltaproteobacteria bacterium]